MPIKVDFSLKTGRGNTSQFTQTDIFKIKANKPFFMSKYQLQ